LKYNAISNLIIDFIRLLVFNHVIFRICFPRGLLGLPVLFLSYFDEAFIWHTTNMFLQLPAT